MLHQQHRALVSVDELFILSGEPPTVDLVEEILRSLSRGKCIAIAGAPENAEMANAKGRQIWAKLAKQRKKSQEI